MLLHRRADGLRERARGTTENRNAIAAREIDNIADNRRGRGTTTGTGPTSVIAPTGCAWISTAFVTPITPASWLVRGTMVG